VQLPRDNGLASDAGCVHRMHATGVRVAKLTRRRRHASCSGIGMNKTPVVAVLYATREGHTRRIAEHVAATLRAREVAADVIDVARPPATLDLSSYTAAVLLASVHMGKHEREMLAFVRERRESLEKMPTAFLSVSVSEAAAESPELDELHRLEAARTVVGMVDDFLAQTGFRPTAIHPVAGALLYLHYGALKRFVVKTIAKRGGLPSDVTKDWELTDWAALDHFVAELLDEVGRRVSARPG
jgi:menaquinone-dependent protoporphyrinogen oxidase